MKYIFLICILSFLLGLSLANASETIYCNYNYNLNFYIMQAPLKKKTIHKEFKNRGLAYKVYINNIKRFTKVDDYITIENKKGHKITYALACRYF